MGLPVGHGPDYQTGWSFGDVFSGRETDYNSAMWMAMLFSHASKTFITSCHMGHERSLTVDERTPEQDWTLTCPLCGDVHYLRAPQIIASDL